jgi:5'-nucleotidase / UDP-sugar diphosphatase
MTKLTRRQALSAMLAVGAGVASPRTRAATPSAARLTFLHVNDVYRIDEDNGRRGGMPRYAAVVKSEREWARAQNRYLIWVHAGDALSPSLMSSFDQGAHMVDLFNKSGLDVFVPGNHEFDFGKDVYFEWMIEARFTILAANLKDREGVTPPYHKESLALEVDGVKLALIGVTYEDTPAVSRPGDLHFLPAVPVAAAQAKSARQAGADFIAVIVHADKQKGSELMNLHAADLILSGHNHDLHVDFDGHTMLIESEQDANYVTVVDIDIARTADAANSRLAWWPEIRIVDTAKIEPDAGVLAKVREYQARLEQQIDVEIAELAAPLDSRTGCANAQSAIFSPMRCAKQRKLNSRSSMAAA